MQARSTSIADVVIIEPTRHNDDRGWFSETFRADWFAQNVADVTFVQENHSTSKQVGTLRGLHFQIPPHMQAKLVRCVMGSIWDVAVDIRLGSPTYSCWTAVELSAQNGLQLYVPAGFAHGFITLQENSEVTYKVSDYYAQECDGGILWNDPEIELPWPMDSASPTVSEKDKNHTRLAEFDNPFRYAVPK